MAATPPGLAAAEQDDRRSAWLVVLEPGTVAPSAATTHSRDHAVVVDRVFEHAISGYAARMTAQTAQRLLARPEVIGVEPDREVRLAAQVLPTGVDRVQADASSVLAGDGQGSVDVDVAVIDTGIAPHPDLVVAGGVGCLSGNTSYVDANGHGTHVAGTIAARDDAQGVVGVAPGARLWAVRVLNRLGAGTLSSIICGIDWVTEHADVIEVANMSLGGRGREPAGAGCTTGDAQHDALCRSVAAGVAYVVAAGNSARDASGYVPAAYDEAITVSALADFDGQPGGAAAATCASDVDDTLASFSNFGLDVDLTAPGVCIRSTWLNGGYRVLNGTSMASPHVAGAAALVRAQATLTPAQLRAALRSRGSSAWNPVDDPDGVKEPLLDVSTG